MEVTARITATTNTYGDIIAPGYTEPGDKEGIYGTGGTREVAEA